MSISTLVSIFIGWILGLIATAITAVALLHRGRSIEKRLIAVEKRYRRLKCMKEERRDEGIGFGAILGALMGGGHPLKELYHNHTFFSMFRPDKDCEEGKGCLVDGAKVNAWLEREEFVRWDCSVGEVTKVLIAEGRKRGILKSDDDEVAKVEDIIKTLQAD
jgi:hypothetical protein